MRLTLLVALGLCLSSCGGGGGGGVFIYPLAGTYDYQQTVVGGSPLTGCADSRTRCGVAIRYDGTSYWESTGGGAFTKICDYNFDGGGITYHYPDGHTKQAGLVGADGTNNSIAQITEDNGASWIVWARR